MSFSGSFTIKGGEADRESLVLSNLTNIVENEVDVNDLTEHDEIFLLACEAALNLTQSGVMGDPKAEYKIVINGHGNPDHKPVPGWANDQVNISIYQV